MLKCWACGHVMKSEPDRNLNPEGEEDLDLMATCPECLTRHVYAEDDMGNPVVIHAIRPDETLIKKAAS